VRDDLLWQRQIRGEQWKRTISLPIMCTSAGQ
jgi:hypothetical protein